MYLCVSQFLLGPAYVRCLLSLFTRRGGTKHDTQVDSRVGIFRVRKLNLPGSRLNAVTSSYEFIQASTRVALKSRNSQSESLLGFLALMYEEN